MVRIVITVSEYLNEWIISKSGTARGDRQRFIVTFLQSLESGLILASHNQQILALESATAVIDEDDARAQEILKQRRKQRSKLDPNKIHIVDLGDEWKENFKDELADAIKNMGISTDTRATIQIMKEESTKVSSVLPSPSIPTLPTPPPLPPKKKDD
jgi:hypothetical protein